MSEIELDSPVACVAELERCSNGLATLTQEITKTLEELKGAEEELEEIEAKAYLDARDSDESKVTAAEIRGRVIQAITADERMARVRADTLSLRTERETLERRLRTLEKRSSAAQSALAKHRDMER